VARNVAPGDLDVFTEIIISGCRVYITSKSPIQCR